MCFFLDKTIGAFEAQVLDGLVSPREFGMFPFGGQEAIRGYVNCFWTIRLGLVRPKLLMGWFHLGNSACFHLVARRPAEGM